MQEIIIAWFCEEFGFYIGWGGTGRDVKGFVEWSMNHGSSFKLGLGIYAEGGTWGEIRRRSFGNGISERW